MGWMHILEQLASAGVAAANASPVNVAQGACGPCPNWAALAWGKTHTLAGSVIAQLCSYVSVPLLQYNSPHYLQTPIHCSRI